MMFKEDFDKLAGAAEIKAGMLRRNPLGYLLLSILAGMFIGFGILLVFTLGGSMAGSPLTRLVMASTFSVALSLVVIGGAELFTGNNLVMTAGILEKKVRLSDTMILWVICWIGNFLGAVLLSIIFISTGLYSGDTMEMIVQGAEAKLALSPVELIARGALCNMLVCMAVWSAGRCKSESGKLIMIFWCILAFYATGFEHSIANMTLLTLYSFSSWSFLPAFATSLTQILTVTIGNMLGGILLVAVPYYLAARK